MFYKYINKFYTVCSFFNVFLCLFVFLISTKGLDIRSCVLVIRFNPLESLNSYIQSRGRARHEYSNYIVMVNKDDIGLEGSDKYTNFKAIESQLNLVVRKDEDSNTVKIEEPEKAGIIKKIK